MTDTSPAAEQLETLRIPGTVVGNSYTIDAGELIADAIDQGIEVHYPLEVNERFTAVQLRDANGGRKLEFIDRRMGTNPLPDFVEHTAAFTQLASFVSYTRRHRLPESTVVYMLDAAALSPESLTRDLPAARVMFDDHPARDQTAPQGIGRRAHRAELVLRPTAAARRWGAALGHRLSQDAFLDVIADGLGEIADPAGADLRDLVSNLFTTSNVTASSVKRTGGSASVTFTENVDLRAGAGSSVSIPENLTLTFRPWSAIDADVVVHVRIKPVVADNGKVLFDLHPVDLDAALAALFDQLWHDIDTELDGIDPLWVAAFGS